MVVRKFIPLLIINCISCLGIFAQGGQDTSVNFYFVINGTRLDIHQLKMLKDFASNYHIKTIKGYADTTGEKNYNLALSRKRAYSVYAVLSKNRDSTNKVDLFSLGENDEKPELWENRRVEVIGTAIRGNVSGPGIPERDPTSDTTGKVSRVLRDFNLEYVYFIPDQAVITQESWASLQELAAILKTYQTETFEIVGHINYQSRFDSTHLTDIYDLSKRRAKLVYDFLVGQGIQPSRMTYRGVGNSEPIYPRPVNDEERRKNMRVQIIIKK